MNRRARQQNQKKAYFDRVAREIDPLRSKKQSISNAQKRTKANQEQTPRQRKFIPQFSQVQSQAPRSRDGPPFDIQWEELYRRRLQAQDKIAI